MENITNIEIKKGIHLHLIHTPKFKTNLLAVFLTTPLQKETVTANSLIPAVLRRGSMHMPTQEEISIALEEMYGASFDCGIDKIGDDQVLKFYMETIHNEFLPQKEDILKRAIDLTFEIIFHPVLVDNAFQKEYVESEKNNLKQVIEGRKDNKASYALDRCIEEMYPNMPYSLYKYGKIEDIESLQPKQLYMQYQKLLKECKIDIFLSGNIEDDVKDKIVSNPLIQGLEERNPIYIVNNLENRKKEKKEEQVITEKMDINQGKLILGLDILEETEKDKYTALVYNAILGGTPTSKMFQNVREKNSLAYTASSSFIRQKANIFIKCGIDIPNFEKAVKIIKQQIEDMKKGEFSDKNIEEAKNNIISTIRFIPEEQDTELMYYFSQELSGYKMQWEEYMEKIKQVSKEEIIELAKRVQINTVYFLKNE